MKNRKIIALLLASVMCYTALGISACSKKDTDDTKETQEEPEKTEKETEETEPTVTETEPVEETEATEADETESTSSNNDEADNADAIAYSLFMDFVSNGSFDSDAEFSFQKWRFSADDPVDSRWGLVVKTGDEFTAYAVIDGQVEETTLGYDWYPQSYLSKEDFLQLPIMVDEISGEIVSSGEIEDGTYYGNILCFDSTGTQALATIAYPIVIEPSTYESLGESDSFMDVFGETYTISQFFSVNDDYDRLIIIDESGEEFDGWFTSNADGSYRFISDSEYTISHNLVLCFIDITDECIIEDHFAWLVGPGDATVGINPDEPLTFINSHYYDYVANYTGGNAYNGWMVGSSAILEPIVIKDGKVVSMVLGWR